MHCLFIRLKLKNLSKNRFYSLFIGNNQFLIIYFFDTSKKNLILWKFKIMKKSLFLVIICVFGTNSFLGQINLVPNSSFETHTICPDYPGQINYASGWNNVNLTYGSFTVGTPDYLNACGSASLGYNTVPPNTFDGVCMPHTGNAMVGTVLYNVPYPEYREYFSTQLTETLTPGNTYTVSFWITNGSTPQSPFIIKNIGVHLSANPLSQTGWNVINMAPTCELIGYSGSSSWVQYTFTVNPVSNLQYITCGSFRPDAANNPISTYTGTAGPPSSYAFYFWDDIQVWKASTATGINENLSAYQNLSVYPNPSNEYIFISSQAPMDNISIMNYSGKEILSEKIEGNEVKLNIKELSKGIYFMHIYYKNQLISIKKLAKD
jgi:hypothetical protein